MIGIMGANSVHGTFFFLRQNLPLERICSEFRKKSDGQESAYIGVSILPNDCGIWARVVSKDPVELRAILRDLWRAARKLMVGSFPNDRKK